MHVRKKKDCPPFYTVVTFGLNHGLDSMRIGIAVEPYPNRWTHHLLAADYLVEEYYKIP